MIIHLFYSFINHIFFHNFQFVSLCIALGKQQASTWTQINQSSFVINRRSHLHVKWQTYEISRQVHIPRQQYLINWKQYQHSHIEGVDCYWQTYYHIEIWSHWSMRPEFFQDVTVSVLLYVWTTWTLMKRMDENQLRKNAGCCFEQILEATPNKTAAVFTSLKPSK